MLKLAAGLFQSYSLGSGSKMQYEYVLIWSVSFLMRANQINFQSWFTSSNGCVGGKEGTDCFKTEPHILFVAKVTHKLNYLCVRITIWMRQFVRISQKHWARPSHISSLHPEQRVYLCIFNVWWHLIIKPLWCCSREASDVCLDV